MNFYSDDNIWTPSSQELSDFNDDGKWKQSPFTAVADYRADNRKVKITILEGPAYDPPEDLDDIMFDFDQNGTEVPDNTANSMALKRTYKVLEVLRKLKEICTEKKLRKTMVTFDENNNYVAVPKKLSQSQIVKRPSNFIMREPRCVFCMKNGEEDIQHRLKDENGRTVCPVLRKFKCRLCGAVGENSHTQKYCPRNPLTKGDPVGAGMPPGLLPSFITFK